MVTVRTQMVCFFAKRSWKSVIRSATRRFASHLPGSVTLNIARGSKALHSVTAQPSSRPMPQSRAAPRHEGQHITTTMRRSRSVAARSPRRRARGEPVANRGDMLAATRHGGYKRRFPR